MYDFLRKRWFLLLFFVIISLVVPAQDLVFAESNNVTDNWLKEQDSKDSNQSEPAQTNNTEETQLTGGQGLSFWDYLKMLFALIFVLGLLLFVLKFINKKSHSYQQNSLVRNIGGVNLGAQKSVQLIQIGNSIYVVGVGEDVQLIKEIENPEEIEQIIANFDERQSFSVTSPYITELVKKLNVKMRKTNEVEEKQQSFGDIFNNKLSDIKKHRQNELEKWKEKERDK